MSKKKQFHLRTVFATGWIEPKSAVTLHTFFNNESKSNFRLKTQQSPRKKRILTQDKDSNLIVRNMVVSRTQRKQTIVASEPKSNLKPFPKRQSILKNSNAFRYFMPSNNRLMTEVATQEQIFFKKLDQLIRQGPYAKSITKFDSLMSKDTKINSKERKRVSLPKQLKRRYTLGDNQHGIQPWRFKQEQDFNDLHIQ